jgi:hypothetical protein
MLSRLVLLYSGIVVKGYGDCIIECANTSTYLLLKCRHGCKELKQSSMQTQSIASSRLFRRKGLVHFMLELSLGWGVLYLDRALFSCRSRRLFKVWSNFLSFNREVQLLVLSFCSNVNVQCSTRYCPRHSTFTIFLSPVLLHIQLMLDNNNCTRNTIVIRCISASTGGKHKLFHLRNYIFNGCFLLAFNLRQLFTSVFSSSINQHGWKFLYPKRLT